MALVGRGLCVQWGWALHCMAEWWGRACAVRGSTAICMGWRRRDGAFLRGALPQGQGYGCCSAFCRCLASFAAHSCAAVTCWRNHVAASGGQGGIGGWRVPPTPSLDSLLTPLYRRRSAEGLEAAERCVLARRSGAGARGLCVALNSSVALRLLWRRPCAAVACWRYRVAASGGQGGPGGLRFPPRPSLDSPLPLETPPLRYGVGGGVALRFCAAFRRCCKG